METIDDIVREMRGNAEHNHALVEVSKYLAEIADRIENAYEHGYHALEGHCKRLEEAYEKQVKINKDLVEENAGMVTELKQLKKKIRGQRKAIRSKESENEQLRAALQPVLNEKPHSSDQQEHEDMPYYKVLVKCHNAVRKAQEIYKQGEKSDE